jgi:hypothetical protein
VVPYGDRKWFLKLIAALVQAPPAAAKQALDRNSPKADHEDAVDIGLKELRQVSMIFADLAEPTWLADRLDIEDKHLLLHKFRSICSQPVRDCGWGRPIREVGNG